MAGSDPSGWAIAAARVPPPSPPSLSLSLSLLTHESRHDSEYFALVGDRSHIAKAGSCGDDSDEVERVEQRDVRRLIICVAVCVDEDGLAVVRQLQSRGVNVVEACGRQSRVRVAGQPELALAEVHLVRHDQQVQEHADANHCRCVVVRVAFDYGREVLQK